MNNIIGYVSQAYLDSLSKGFETDGQGTITISKELSGDATFALIKRDDAALAVKDLNIALAQLLETVAELEAKRSSEAQNNTTPNDSEEK